MAKDDIMDIKQRVAAFQAKLNAAAQEGRKRGGQNPLITSALIWWPYDLDEMTDQPGAGDDSA